jgi:hypothetical protein
MDKKRRMIGNEAEGGTRRLAPPRQRPRTINQRFIDDYRVVNNRRQQLIDIAAKPPSMPVATKVLPPRVTENNNFNQIAYSVLLISILAAVAVGTNFINWEFLIYGVLAVLARLPSTQMFVAALISLVLIPVTTVFQRNSLANTFSVMAFYFLLIGLIRASLELRRDSKNSKKITPVKRRASLKGM